MGEASRTGLCHCSLHQITNFSNIQIYATSLQGNIFRDYHTTQHSRKAFIHAAITDNGWCHREVSRVQHLPETEGEGIIAPHLVLAVIVVNAIFLQCGRRGIPCSPCLKSGKVCTGYTRDRLFKNLSALDRDSLLSRSQPLIPNTEPSILRHDSKDRSPRRCSNPGSLIYTPPLAWEIDPQPRSLY
jgi:hypothetical protein